MNKLSTWTFLGLLVFASSGFAATQAQMDSDIEVLRSAIRTERQAVVAMNMELADSESEKFWKMYREYQEEMRTINDRSTQMIVKFAKNFRTLTDEQASTMLSDWSAVEKDQVNLKSKYIKKFGKILPASKVARYFQIENKMDAVIRMDMAQEIPLTMTAKATK